MAPKERGEAGLQLKRSVGSRLSGGWFFKTSGLSIYIKDPREQNTRVKKATTAEVGTKLRQATHGVHAQQRGWTQGRLYQAEQSRQRKANAI